MGVIIGYAALRLLIIFFGYFLATLSSSFVVLIFLSDPSHILQRVGLMSVIVAWSITAITAGIPTLLFVLYSELIRYPSRVAHITAGIVTAAVAHLLAAPVFGYPILLDPEIVVLSLLGGGVGGFFYWLVSVCHLESRNFGSWIASKVAEYENPHTPTKAS